MYLIQVKNQIFAHFLKNQAFSDSDFHKINLITDLGEAFKNGVIKLALSHLVESKVLSEIKTKQSCHWILTTPLENLSQSVTFTGPEAAHIGRILNDLGALVGMEENVDYTSISAESFLRAFTIMDAVLGNAKEVIQGIVMKQMGN